jgi:hypothetical protein
MSQARASRGARRSRRCGTALPGSPRRQSPESSGESDHLSVTIYRTLDGAVKEFAKKLRLSEELWKF